MLITLINSSASIATHRTREEIIELQRSFQELTVIFLTAKLLKMLEVHKDIRLKVIQQLLVMIFYRVHTSTT